MALPLFEKSLIGTYYNSLVLLTPEGTIGAVYRKVHVPCTRSYERYYFTPGPEFVVADTRYGKVGLAICYDRRYPETCRELMKKGARLILISISSSIMPGGFSELPVFETELKTRAFENQLFLAACNRSGQEGEYTFFGHSMLLGPDGSVLAQADEAENVVVLAEMELEDADRARINGPLLRTAARSSIPADINQRNEVIVWNSLTLCRSACCLGQCDRPTGRHGQELRHPRPDRDGPQQHETLRSAGPLHRPAGGRPAPRYSIRWSPTLTTTVMEGAALAREQGCDLVIGMGGGSMMDAAKAVAFCAVNGGDVNDYISGGKQGIGCLPILEVPTTCGTGARPTPLRC